MYRPTGAIASNGFATTCWRLFGVYAHLDERPIYEAEKSYPHVKDGFMVIMGLDDATQFDAIVDHHERGSIPPPTMWGSRPTRFDPSQAPAGYHTAFMWEKLPYALGGDAKRLGHRGSRTR